MNVLLIGSGGREHALAWKIAASPLLTKLYAAPGNPGIGSEAELVELDIADHAAVAAFCREKIDRLGRGRARRRRWWPGSPTICAPAGIARLRPVHGGGAARRLQGFHQGPLRQIRHPDRRLSAASTTPSRRRPMCAKQGAPIVIKADGLAAGKGVTVAMTLDEALAAIDDCFRRRLRRGRRRSRGRGVSRPARRRASSASATARPRCPSARRRTTSASATAIPGRTPAAWAPIRRRR